MAPPPAYHRSPRAASVLQPPVLWLGPPAFPRSGVGGAAAACTLGLVGSGAAHYPPSQHSGATRFADAPLGLGRRGTILGRDWDSGHGGRGSAPVGQKGLRASLPQPTVHMLPMQGRLKYRAGQKPRAPSPDPIFENIENPQKYLYKWYSNIV